MPNKGSANHRELDKGFYMSFNNACATTSLYVNTVLELDLLYNPCNQPYTFLPMSFLLPS